MVGSSVAMPVVGIEWLIHVRGACFNAGMADERGNVASGGSQQ